MICALKILIHSACKHDLLNVKNNIIPTFSFTFITICFIIKNTFFETLLCILIIRSKLSTMSNVQSYNRIFCYRTVSFLNLHPEATETLCSFFKATSFDPMKPSHQIVAMTRESEKTIMQFYDQVSGRESLEMQKHLCGRKRIIFPVWCLEAIQSIIYYSLVSCFSYSPIYNVQSQSRKIENFVESISHNCLILRIIKL